MKRIIAVLCISLPALTMLYAQQPVQTVKGVITDKASERPLVNVSVLIPGTTLGTKTDSLGRYSLPAVPLGRHQLSFSIVGYKTITIPEVLVTAGKQVVLDVPLDEAISALNGVTVTSRTRKGMAANEFAGSSARSFSMEEVTRYAGGRNDPARLASNFAGVATTNDSRNDIVVRGNSPTAVLWRMEGVPIPSPNHFSTLGTTGSAVSALNTNALKNSDFYTGAFPAEFGNATGAVFDISLRNGNKDKLEKTIQLNMFSGLEAMLEGPLSRNKNGSSFLVGYRYSFAQIGQSLGLDVGTSAVPRYQDLTFHFNFAKSKLGRFSVFGLGATSGIDFIGADIDSTDLFANKNEDSYFKSRIGLIGVKHTLDIGRNSYLRTVVSYSHVKSEGDTYRYYEGAHERTYLTEQSTTNTGLRVSSFINSKMNNRFTVRGGLLAEQIGLNTFLRTRDGRPDWETIRDYNGHSWLLQPFVQGKYRFTEKLSLNTGLHGIYYALNSSSALEPRASVNYAIAGNKSITFSYGLHHQQQPLPVYMYQERQPDGSYNQQNRKLGFTKAHHYVLGYDWSFARDWRLKAEAYYQSVSNAPVEQIPTGFSVLNSGADFTFPEKAGLVNKGTASNRGVELTIEKFFSRGFYLLATGSLFDAKYKGSDQIERNSTFNNKNVLNVLVGREWKMGYQGHNSFTIDIKCSRSGGRYYTPVDLDRSIALQKEVLDETRYNSEQLKSYFRLDTRFGFRLNNPGKHRSHTIYLDLQNVTNNDNIFVQRYNQVTKKVGAVNQIGFFPDILYRLQF